MKTFKALTYKVLKQQLNGIIKVKILSILLQNISNMHWWTKAGLWLWVHKTQTLFWYYYLFLYYMVFHMNHCKPTFAQPVYDHDVAVLSLTITSSPIGIPSKKLARRTKQELLSFSEKGGEKDLHKSPAYFHSHHLGQNCSYAQSLKQPLVTGNRSHDCH